MGFYQDQIVPLLINLTMRRRDLAAYRSRVVLAADGRVLEIGIGSGLNLPFYSRNVEHLIGLDPSPKLLSMVRRNLRPGTPSVELIEGSAEAIPLENNSVDTVVTTWTLCSIPDVARSSRNESGPQANRAPPLYRTWPRSRGERALVAGPFNSGLEMYRRWLPLKPRDPEFDRRCWLPI
jgi:SAM-dependent methyltransferase